MKNTTKLLCAAAGICLLVSCLLTVIFQRSFDENFYEKEYAANHQAEVINMSDEDLMKATNTLLDYLKDKRDDIVVEAEVNGIDREVFNERETLHMVDVKNLLQNAVKARNILFGAGALLLALLLYVYRKMPYTIVHYAYCAGLIVMGILIAFVSIWAIVDFDTFWVDFHYLFFDNDLFFLDPNTSIMINMFPDTFFFDLVRDIVAEFIAIAAGCGVCLFFWKKKIER